MDVHPNTVLRGEPRFSPYEVRFGIPLAWEGRHRVGAVHVRTGRNGGGRDGARAAHCKGCSVNCQHRSGCSRDSENFFGLLHFLPSLWNWPLGREKNRESPQAASESEGIAWKTKQGVPLARGSGAEL